MALGLDLLRFGRPLGERALSVTGASAQVQRLELRTARQGHRVEAPDAASRGLPIHAVVAAELERAEIRAPCHHRDVRYPAAVAEVERVKLRTPSQRRNIRPADICHGNAPNALDNRKILLEGVVYF